MLAFEFPPLTRPRSFASLLENYGFVRKSEQSVTVFKGKRVEDRLKPEVKVEEISESEINVYNKLNLTVFEMPVDWKGAWDKLVLEWIRRVWKCYLAYVEEKPVGTCAMFSLMKAGGIFNVGTLKEYRRRGIGTTLTVPAVMDSIDEGNNLHTLQRVKGGNAERLYKNTGFVTDHAISYLAKKFQGKNRVRKKSVRR